MLGRKVQRMLSHPITDDHLAPVIEQYLGRLDASALGRPMDGKLPERRDAGPSVEKDLDRLVPSLGTGNFQRRRSTQGSGAVQVDRGGVASEKFGQLLVLA